MISKELLFNLAPRTESLMPSRMKIAHRLLIHDDAIREELQVRLTLHAFVLQSNDELAKLLPTSQE